VRVFENHRGDDAYHAVLQQLDVDHDGSLSEEEKQNARIILYGHSWGASQTVELARQLKRVDVPVLLTIQVDSVHKIGENDAVIPSNVEQAVNFYQPHGIVHGRAQIRAADPDRTEVMGNFRFDYSGSALRCQSYPWFNRLLIKPHVQIECDPEVWDQVEALIRSRLLSNGKIALQQENFPALMSQKASR
jgi:pimeloyl-ACP methyl ester carboxylesterase